ncbi:MAG: imidazole glycerol phosphate synthase subunit HisH [Actinobacteria bacterium]|nr:MAG: imidazole glycerol phosphate synthase subunit HisH [Actinomycetota bacterium]
MTNVTVLDFEMGNLRSVAKALEKVGASVDVSAEVDRNADALVVPGQGAFGSCVLNLGARMDDVRAWIADGLPYLGICLGLQVLFDSSEESEEKGASVFAGDVVRFPAGPKVPHIGWNEVSSRAGTRLFDGIDAGTRFYFVHSYYPVPADAGVVAATSDYAVEFCCAAERENVMATQFHPEKSGDAGLALLSNFVRAAAR